MRVPMNMPMPVSVAKVITAANGDYQQRADKQGTRR
jgi:hypothetical protein